MRAWYYAWAGNAPETAYVKEMELVRKGVGLADVSTLGKIDVQGPDAAEFLNRVYVNGFAKLPVGKVRYGVMLNDDGVVLDDGTTARISETQFYMTTTTAQAGEVMSWLEYLLQCHWTDLNVQVASLTDEWAGMAVSGPQSRAALELAFPGVDVSDAALPHMGCRDIAFDGVTVRLLRMSFSGELAYEVHVAADYAIALWEHILKSAAPLGIRPYGLEALASLRIEKGHVAGLELDHRNTLDDLGLGKMAGKDKAYVGKALRFREKLQAPERWSLVGLELLEPDKKLRGGSILFAAVRRDQGPWPRLHHLRHLVDGIEQLHCARSLSGRPQARGRGDRLCLSAEGRTGAGADRVAAFHRQGRGTPPCLNGGLPWPQQSLARAQRSKSASRLISH